MVLGVTGGIAAYKSAFLARRLVERGAEVRVMLSRSALEFIGIQTFAAITGRPVETGLFGADAVSPHTELAGWAEVIVIAPATTGLLGRLAAAISDDLVTATLLAARCPVVLAPAMHTEMWQHPATQRAVERLRADGHRLVGPAEGALAGGDEGPGRMVEPEEILAAVEIALGAGDLAGLRILVTAGGTREPIDPVRYVGNRSSGRMGHAVAEEAFRRGAAVTLVTTTSIPAPGAVERVQIETAEEMAEAVWSRAGDVDVVVMAAAVADFRPKDAAEIKLSRRDGPPDLLLEPTPDILGGVLERASRPFVVGFAAETGSLERAVDKARRKPADLTVANDVTAEGSGFGSSTNQVSIIRPDGRREDWPLLEKGEVATRLWDLVAAELA